MRAIEIGALSLLFLSQVAVADRVWLNNGNYLDGDSHDRGDGQVEIRSSVGTFTLSWNQIERIERFETVEEVAEGLLAELPPDDVVRRFELARWCDEHGASTLAQRLLRQILAIEPDHGEARRLLGYRYYNGAWFTDDEYHNARGEISFRGEWMSPQERRQILALESLQAEASMRRAAREAQLRAEIYRLQQEIASQPYVDPFFPVGTVFPPPLLQPVVKLPRPVQVRRRPVRLAPPAAGQPAPSGERNVSGFRPPAPRASRRPQLQ